MENMKHAPEKVKNAIRARAEMLGLPRIGTPENWAYTALQCNISSVLGQKDGAL